MSTDIIAQLKNQQVTVPKGLDEDTLAVAGGASTGGTKRISIRGGVFRKVVGGKEVANIEDRHMNVIFVKMAHKASRTFYDSSYKEGEKVAPVCWSSDSNTPDADVETKQAKACNECPHSVRGAQKQCRLSWRTAVVLPDDPGGDVLQLVLPATSSFGKESNGKYPFRPYVQTLASNNISASRVVTRMQFDTNSPTPKLLFSAVGIVPEEQLETLVEQRNSKVAEQAVKLTVYQADSNEAPQQTQAKPIEIQEPVEQPVQQTQEPIQEPLVKEAPKEDLGDVAEPTLRNAEQVNNPAEKVNDVSDIISKWSTKD